MLEEADWNLTSIEMVRSLEMAAMVSSQSPGMIVMDMDSSRH